MSELDDEQYLADIHRELDRLRSLVEKYETRLEITHCFELRPASERTGDVDNDLVRKDLTPKEREKFPDAVECRDASIAVLEEIKKDLEAALAAANETIRQLREAAEPFAKFIEGFNEGRPDSEEFHRVCRAGGPVHAVITLGDYRKLAALLPDPTPAKG